MSKASSASRSNSGPDNKILEAMEQLPLYISLAPTVMMIIGFLVA